MANGSPVILMVEDEPNDAFLLRRALQKANVTLPIRLVCDGQEAIDYLGSCGEGKEHPTPCLIILDLKLPKKTGLEVLSWLRRHETLKDLPVFMLTSSGEPQDRDAAQHEGVEAYRVKPVSLEDLVRVAAEIRRETEEHCGGEAPKR